MFVIMRPLYQVSHRNSIMKVSVPGFGAMAEVSTIIEKVKNAIENIH